MILRPSTRAFRVGAWHKGKSTITDNSEPAKHWLDAPVNDPAIHEFIRLGMPGIRSVKTREELTGWIQVQRERHYPLTAYDEKANMKWNMLQYHFENFKRLEAALDERPF